MLIHSFLVDQPSSFSFPFHDSSLFFRFFFFFLRFHSSLYIFPSFLLPNSFFFAVVSLSLSLSPLSLSIPLTPSLSIPLSPLSLFLRFHIQWFSFLSSFKCLRRCTLILFVIGLRCLAFVAILWSRNSFSQPEEKMETLMFHQEGRLPLWKGQ